MKTKNLLPLFFFILLGAVWGKAKAQGPDIQSLYTDSTGSSCATQSFDVWGTAFTSNPPLTFVIDFGDGTDTTILSNMLPTFHVEAEHTYLAPGTYTVTATVIDLNSGLTDTESLVIIAGSDVVAANFSYLNNGCNVFDFVDASSASSGINAWIWDFGDGTSLNTSPNPTHSYNSVGTYPVTLTAYSANGCQSTLTQQVSVTGAVTIGANTSNASCGNCADGSATAVVTGGTGPYTYQWSDGQTTATAANLLPGTYTVQVYDINGCSNSLVVTISSPMPTSITASVIDSTHCSGLDFLGFLWGQASGYTYPDNVSVFVDYGDGTTNNQTVPIDQWGNFGASVDHTYASAGTYPVTYTVTGSDNTTFNGSLNVTVGATINAGFTYTSSSSLNCGTIQFINTSTSSTGTIDGIYWDLGDGTSSSANSPAHTYNSPGSYVVYINVSAGNCYNSYIDTITIDTCDVISGIAFYDSNSDCSYTSGEFPLAGVLVELLDNTNQPVAFAYTDVNGAYSFNVAAGNYNIQVNNAATMGYAISCTNSQPHGVTAPSTGNDFALNCQNVFDLAATFLSGWGFRPADPAYIYSDIMNFSCAPTSGSIKIVLDPLLSYVSPLWYTSAPVVIPAATGDTLLWNFTGLTNMSTIWSDVMVVTDSSANIGDSVCITLIVSATTPEGNITNNVLSQCFPVVNSYDPNMKTVFPAGEGMSGNIPPTTENLTYTVHFQNTGNAVAYNVFIMDTLDTDLNTGSLVILDHSHGMTTEILGTNVVKFTFDNIMLADSFSNEPASHGFVSYRIAPNANLALGTEIKNTAHIYFDLNPAIVTNTTLNTIALPSSVKERKMTRTGVTMYPNPAKDQVMVSVNEKQIGQEMLIMDMVGQVVLKQTISAQTINIDVKNLPSGIYSVIINANGERSAQRLVVAH